MYYEECTINYNNRTELVEKLNKLAKLNRKVICIKEKDYGIHGMESWVLLEVNDV